MAQLSQPEASSTPTAYEALVRKHLSEYGFDASVVPDSTLRSFLADFERSVSVHDPWASGSAGAGRAPDGELAEQDEPAESPPAHLAALWAPDLPPANRQSGSRIKAVDTRVRIKSDPVAIYARRAEGWKNDAFLAVNPGSSRATSRPLSARAPKPAEAARARRRGAPTFVVPTTKRRDDVVQEVRARMRMKDAPTGPPRRKGLVPNAYVPPTEKRRDELRWAVRSEMAWAY